MTPTTSLVDDDRASAKTRIVTTSGLLSYPAFVRLWIADAVSSLGSFTSALALQYVVIETLQADQRVLGVVRAAQWLPSLLLGMVIGVLVDRIRRRRAIVAADLLSAAALGAIAALAWSDRLSVVALVALVFVVGLSSTLFQAAHQSYLPGLVPTTVLPRAHARFDQTMTAAQSVGPLVAGAVVRYLDRTSICGVSFAKGRGGCIGIARSPRTRCRCTCGSSSTRRS